jgi:DNA-binding PadR family transcriptional regulator
MAVQHILLGMLSLKPSTGYDLKKMFDAGDRLARPHIPLSRIYPVLKSMVEQGLVTFEEVARTGSPDLKIYSITPEGWEFFLSWLREPICGDRYRFTHFLEKISFSPMLEKEEVLTLIDDELAFRRQQLEDARTTPIVPIEEYNPQDIQHFQRFTQISNFLEDFGNANLENFIHWLERTRQHIVEQW